MSDGRIVCHMAVPEPKRLLASTSMRGLEGGIGNFSVELLAVGGDSLAWATFKGYGPKYWGASQALAPADLLLMLEDGYTNTTEIIYAAFHEGTGLPVETGNPLRPGCNLTSWPANASFGAFLAAGIWERVIANA